MTKLTKNSLKYEPVSVDRDARLLFTDEEIAESNAREIEKNDAGMELIRAAGFIPFPLFAEDIEGNSVIGEAWVHPEFEPSCQEGFAEKHGMDYNIYVPSYERSDAAATIDMLMEFESDNWYLAVDPSQFEAYSKVFPHRKLVIRDISFRQDHMVDLVSSIKSPNSMHGHAGICNFLLSFSRSMGEERYWTMDDDIYGLAMKAHKYDGMKADEKYDKFNFFRCSRIREEFGFDFQEFMHEIEDFAKTIRNPGFIGLEKFGLVFTLPVMWKTGTRVYSFYLSDNKTQVQHFGQHNNDVVTSLELSKNGLVNCLFEGISYNSGATQTGGGQTEVYKKFGTLDKGKILVRSQPNFAKISFEYSRIHHNVDYNTTNGLRMVGVPIES